MTDELSGLPIELFVTHITYLPFKDVVSICSANKKLYSYCTDQKYNKYWRQLIENTFGDTPNYKENLQNVWGDLENKYRGKYNYLVYTQFIKLLDLETQLEIYSRQNDLDSYYNLRRSNLVQHFKILTQIAKNVGVLSGTQKLQYPDGTVIGKKEIKKLVKELRKEIDLSYENQNEVYRKKTKKKIKKYFKRILKGDYDKHLNKNILNRLNLPELYN